MKWGGYGMKILNHFSDTNWIEGYLTGTLKNVLKVERQVIFDQLKKKNLYLTQDRVRNLFISISGISPAERIQGLLQVE